MDLKKNKALVTAVVLFVVFGLVLAYVPLFFTPAPQPNPVPPSQSATLVPPPTGEKTEGVEVIEEEVPAEEEIPPLPDSFSGLEEESESLDGLLDF